MNDESEKVIVEQKSIDMKQFKLFAIFLMVALCALLITSCQKDESNIEFKMEGTIWKGGANVQAKEFKFTTSTNGTMKLYDSSDGNGNYTSYYFSYNYDDDIRTGQIIVSDYRENFVFTINKEHTQMIINFFNGAEPDGISSYKKEN